MLYNALYNALCSVTFATLQYAIRINRLSLIGTFLIVLE